MTPIVPDSNNHTAANLATQGDRAASPARSSGVFLKIPEDIRDRPHYPSPEIFSELAHSRCCQSQSVHPNAPYLAFAGLAAAADQWTGVLAEQHQLTGAMWEAHCLKGHEVGWTGLINTHAEDWIEDIIEKALAIRRETGRKPVLFGHSTGALACIAAVAKYAKEHPGDQLCAGLVISSPAFRLRSTVYSGAILGAKLLHALLPRSGVWGTAGASVDSASVDPTEERITVRERLASAFLKAVTVAHRVIFRKPAEEAPIEKKRVTGRMPPQEDHTPTIKVLPILTFLELRKIQKYAQVGIEKIDVPTLAIVSRHDHLANPKATMDAFRKIPAKDKNSIVLDGPHSLMRDNYSVVPELKATPSEAFNCAIRTWLEDRANLFNRRDDLLTKDELAALGSSEGELADKAPYTSPPQLNLKRLRDILELRSASLN